MNLEHVTHHTRLIKSKPKQSLSRKKQKKNQPSKRTYPSTFAKSQQKDLFCIDSIHDATEKKQNKRASKPKKKKKKSMEKSTKLCKSTFSCVFFE